MVILAVQQNKPLYMTMLFFPGICSLKNTSQKLSPAATFTQRSSIKESVIAANHQTL